jgi:hypothetical protein
MTLQGVLAAFPTFSDDAVPCGLVLDSCPGDHGLSSSLSSMTPSNPVLYLIAAPIIAAAYGLFVLRTIFEGRPPVFTEMRASLLKPNILPDITLNVPRIYIYSVNDRIVHSADVEEHIAQASQATYAHSVQKFTASSHVGHAVSVEERYWRAISEFWGHTRTGLEQGASTRE